MQDVIRERDTLRTEVRDLRRELGDVRSEIRRHHDDFTKVREVADELEHSSYAWLATRLRNIVG